MSLSTHQPDAVGSPTPTAKFFYRFYSIDVGGRLALAEDHECESDMRRLRWARSFSAESLSENRSVATQGAYRHNRGPFVALWTKASPSLRRAPAIRCVSAGAAAGPDPAKALEAECQGFFEAAVILMWCGLERAASVAIAPGGGLAVCGVSRLHGPATRRTLNVEPSLFRVASSAKFIIRSP